MTLPNILLQLCPDLSNGDQYTIVDRADGNGPQTEWASGTPDPRATASAIAALASAPDPKTPSQVLAACSAIFAGQSDNTQVILAQFASEVVMFLQAGNIPVAKTVITAAQNPANSGLTSDQFSALQASLLACF